MAGSPPLADQLVAVASAAVVRTGDVAWPFLRFDRSAKRRPGAVEVPTGLELVVVEGEGAGRPVLVAPAP